MTTAPLTLYVKGLLSLVVFTTIAPSLAYSDLHTVHQVSSGLSRHLRARRSMEFVLSDHLLVFRRVEDHEVVDEVSETGLARAAPPLCSRRQIDRGDLRVVRLHCILGRRQHARLWK